MTRTEEARQGKNRQARTSANCADCGRPSPDIDLVCDYCGHITLMDASASFRQARLGLVVQVTALMLSIFGAVSLFRATGDTWPLYLLVVVGTVNLFAVVTSRAAALPFAVAQTVVATVGWASWEIGSGIGVFPSAASAVDTIWSSVPATLLCAGTVVAFLIGRFTALPGMRTAASWYLAIATFVLGSLAVWGTLVEADEVPDFAYHVVLGFILILPIVILFAILGRERPVEDSRANSAAVWFLLVAAYLTSIEYLIDASGWFFGDFLPELLGEGSVPAVQPPDWLSILRWKSLVTTILAVGAVAFVGASSVIDALGEFRASKRGYYNRRLNDLRSARQSKGKDPAAQAAFQSRILTLQFSAALNVLYDFTSRTTIIFVTTLIGILRRTGYYLLKLVRYLSPIIAFTALGAITILTLEDFSQYVSGLGEAPEPEALWGEAITVMISTVALSALSFGLIRTTGGRAFSAQRRLFAGAESATLLLFGTIYFPYTLITVVAVIPLWYALEGAGIDVPVLSPGPILYINLLAIVAVVILVFVLRITTLSRRPAKELADQVTRREGTLFKLTAAVLVLFAIAGLVLGVQPIAQRVIDAMS